MYSPSPRLNNRKMMKSVMRINPGKKPEFAIEITSRRFPFLIAKSNPILAERDPESEERLDGEAFWFNSKDKKLFVLRDQKASKQAWDSFDAVEEHDRIVIID